MKKDKILYYNENTKLLMNDNFVTIVQGRGYIYLTVAFLMFSMFTISLLLIINTKDPFVLLVFIPLFLFIMNSFIYKSVEINLSTSAIQIKYLLFTKTIWQFKSFSFENREFDLEVNEGDETANYDLFVDGTQILSFNSYDSAINTQRNINRGGLIYIKSIKMQPY